MQSPKRAGRRARRQQPVIEPAPEGAEPLDTVDTEDHASGQGDLFEADDAFDTHRVVCPDCAQSIALLADEDMLPEHALCPSPWDPFGLTVCAGTGRPMADARPEGTSDGAQEQEAALLLTLPQGLDWRTQPFSHAGGPGSRPVPGVPLRHRAA